MECGRIRIMKKAIYRGFSLIELLVVLAVVGLLMAFAAPNIFSLVQSSTLTSEGSLLRNQLTYAQQLAVSKSADVEIRFFKWEDNTSATDGPTFSAFQLYQFNEDGKMAPITEFFRIRAPATVIEDPQYSSLLFENPGSGSDKKYGFESPRRGSAPAPRGEIGSSVNTEYMAFRFRPDGSTDLPNKSSANGGKDTWHITIAQGPRDASGGLPNNYVCLQINPYNGVITEFRP